jgi:diguanylate cyclase (GGDEF)-like protein
MPVKSTNERRGGVARRRSVPRAGQSAEERRAQHMRRLGESVLARADEVLRETVARTRESGEEVGPAVQRSFEQICTNSTVAVARWIAGDGLEVTNDSARETSRIFGELAARRAASLQEVTRRMFWWRNVFAEVMRDAAVPLKTPREVLRDALDLLQVSVEFSLLRVCQSFEKERMATDEQLARREEELAFMATHDPLTNLPNRTLIVDRIEQMAARGAREGTSVAALFIDLDNFKTINDTLGHGMGDELLKAVAARLQGVVREVDALGRLGGDEFVVLVGDLAPDAGPTLVAERLLDALKQPFKLGPEGDTTVSVGASIGIAVGDRATAGTLLRDADIAMYRAKWDGRNRYALYETGMQDAVQERMELEMDLRTALEEEQFFLAYQPTLDLARMLPTGVEALIRWRHPKRGIVQPASFIPLLEETGLITEVGRWVLREGCRQGASWLAAGHDVTMAVNVSGRQLDSDRLIADIREALAESGLPASALTIEITETTLMRDVEQTAGRLAAIKELGVRIAIDDFGTGYSSLAHLQRFPVDALKIDRSFVAGMSNNREGETLIQTLVQLGKALSIETVAEGIEAHSELALLRAQDCEGGQGFLFAKPLAVEDVEAFLRDWPAQQGCAEAV